MSFIIIGLTVLAVLLVPYLIETGVVPIKNKMLAYSIIFLIMIGVSFLVSFILKRQDNKVREYESRKHLYDVFLHDYDSDKISYDLAKLGIERKSVRVEKEKDIFILSVSLAKGVIELTVGRHKTELSLKLKPEALSNTTEEEANRLNALVAEAHADPKLLITEDKDTIYKRIAKIYKEI